MDKKVLLLSYRLGYNSLLYWDSILSGVKKKHTNFRVFTAWDNLSTKDKSITTEERLKGIKYYKNKNKINQKLFFIPLPLFLIDVFKYKPDVVILNEFNITSFYMVVYKLLFKKVKLLLLVESDPNVGNKSHTKKGIRYLYRKFITKKVDLIHTNNNLGLKYLVNGLDVNKNSIEVNPYLTSEPLLCKTPERSINEKKIKFLYVGQHVERKGLINFLEALSILSNADKVKISVDFIGSGNQEKMLKDFSVKNNLTFINFHGQIEFEKLSNYYAEADCFVIPTLHDYRALVGFEALHYKCAVIDSIYDGARFEVVEENKNGFIIDPKDTNTFSQKLHEIISNQKMLEEFKNHSLIISKNYTAQKCTQNLIDSIERVSNE
jgi:glycosyltransferase involved in cell wall biosynthesis